MDLVSLLRYAAPVALASLGETVGQASGVIQIGLEGMMLCGAFFGMLATYLTGSAWLGVGAGASAGLIMALASAVFTIKLNQDQVVVGAALNLFALGLTGTLYRARFGQSGQLLSIPKIPQWHGLDLVQVFLIASVPGLWFVFKRTGWGLALRAAGEYPEAAEACGFSVMRLRTQSGVLTGCYAGLAGAYLSVGIAGSFAENMTSGRGFIAIAMVTFGRWKPQFVFLAALLVGFVESLQYRFQTYGWHAPFQLMLALPYVVALLILVAAGRGTLAPAALGRPYRREG